MQAIAGQAGMRLAASGDASTSAGFHVFWGGGRMFQRARRLVALGSAVVVLCLATAPLAAQGNGKRYKVTHDRAVTVTREVLVRQGFEVVRIEMDGPAQVVYYRAGNRGKGKGKGKIEKMVIRREAERVIFVDTPPAILVDIDLRLRL
jgi:hypothetical protein